MESNQDRMPIAHNVRNVLKSFRTVATLFKHEIDSLDYQAEHDLLLTLENENTRFGMWAGNLAAHQSGPASLDHRLREAPHIREQVLYLLRDILESLEDARLEVVRNTVASTLPEHLKGSGVIDEDNRSDMAMSETSYATSAGYLTMENGEMKPAPPLKVPPRPPEADRGVFECPFCYRMISASTRGAWKRHVFGDLRPYTCLFSRCAESNTDFDRRHRWQLHVSQYHWRTWSCPFNCGSTFQSGVELRDHIRHKHLPNASDEHLNTVVARGEVSVSSDVTQECPLCRRAISGLKSYIKHVGRHLEQLALFALPSIGDEQLEDDVDSGEQNDEASEVGAISADHDSETSSEAEDNQAESNSPNTMTVGHDGEADVTAGEMSGGDAPVPSAASSISSGRHEMEPDEIRKLVQDGDIAKALLAEAESRFTKEWEETRDVSESLKWFKNVQRVTKAMFEESAKSAEQAPVGFKEQETPPTDPSEEAGPAAQVSRPTYTRFSRRHLSIETLREFNINFDFDADPDYVLVERWVPEWEQDQMWKHTKLIRDKRAETLQGESVCQTGESDYERVRDRGSRHPEAPPPLPSVGDHQRIHIRAINRESGTPPSPSPLPPPSILQGPTIG
ncbi:uncharacterized protein FMAN_08287 [Fusarium mangiferae]|uniref:C2H2-type domain-containing protein n=1 Tax=Fusarium mangiferae TaxID=192010 RepID=A0A1L7U3I4_FUSMA|nr:uncharacterized protein FMAN_08287 [Fusarium mangiferae]CVL02217.1 uncharacterized protein FMAN_08287 [Fusarium mangiferae]